MGFFEEFKRLAHPNEDEDAENFNDYEDETPAPEHRERRSERSERRERRTELSDNVTSFSDIERRNKVVNIRANTQLQVVLVKPERFEDASAIADHLRERRTVVLNLESTPKDIARRLLDFLSGVAYANEGKIKKAAISTYIITPYNVDIVGGDLMDELENSGLHF